MNRMIKSIIYKVDGPHSLADPLKELAEQAESGKYHFLLAHLADGVIWGVIRASQLVLSSDAFPKSAPAWRAETLQEARLFGPGGECFFWHAEDGWQRRIVTDGEGKEAEYYDENLILWGTDKVGDPKDGFQMVQEADMGIQHAPPLLWKGRHSLHLLVRHYLDYDDQGAIFIRLSRLVDLQNGGEK